MRRVLCWLCLLIAVTGPLICQAKLAYGFGLSLAEIGQNLYESAEEEADEDCCDCELVAVKAVSLSELDATSLDLLSPRPFFRCSVSALDAHHPQVTSTHRRATTAQSRRALLQSFLF